MLVYVVDQKSLVMIKEGRGEQLDDEDYEEGYDSYLEYTIDSWTDGEENLFNYIDSGIYMYKSSEFPNWKDVIPEVYVYLWGGHDPAVIVIDENLEY